jgi:hypothetical protein
MPLASQGQLAEHPWSSIAFMSTHLHETDFYTWTQQQADLLREQRLDQLDAEHLIEELLDMGASQERELESRLAVLLAHLLEWRYQPERRGKSWRATIEEQRYGIGRLLAKNPGLESQLPDAFQAAYVTGVLKAVKETPMDEDDFPDPCPFTLEQTLEADFWP